MAKNVRRVATILYLVAAIFYVIALYFSVKGDSDHAILGLCYGSILLGISGHLSNIVNRNSEKTK